MSWGTQVRLRTLTLDGVHDGVRENDGGKVITIGDVFNALFVRSFPATVREADLPGNQMPSCKGIAEGHLEMPLIAQQC